jgi:hypothetical protein
MNEKYLAVNRNRTQIPRPQPVAVPSYSGSDVCLFQSNRTRPLVRDFTLMMEARGLTEPPLTAYYTTWSVITQKINI